MNMNNISNCTSKEKFTGVINPSASEHRAISRKKYFPAYIALNPQRPQCMTPAFKEPLSDFNKRHNKTQGEVGCVSLEG